MTALVKDVWRTIKSGAQKDDKLVMAFMGGGLLLSIALILLGLAR